MTVRRLLSFVLLAASYAVAQVTAPPFVIRTQQGTNVQIIGDGGTLTLPSEGIGLPSDASITVTYRPSTASSTATITSIDVTGSTDFTLPAKPDLGASGLTLTGGIPTFGMNVRFTPSSSKLIAGKIVVAYTENNRPGSFTVNLTGATAEFVFTYAVQPNSNTTLLTNGGTLAFPPSPIDQNTDATVIVTNKGSGQGTVNQITYSGSDRFALIGLPFPPATVDAGKDLRFGIRFTPKQLDNVNGALRIDLPGNRTVAFTVAGSGQGAVFSYEITEPAGGAVQPNQAIALPDTVVGGEKTTATIRIRNTGNADGVIQLINVAGNGFAVIEAPFLPYTLTPGSAATVKIQFSPTQPGRATGRLRIGQDNFELVANGLGSSLTFSYAAGGSAVPVANSGTVVFPLIQVGQTTTVRFQMRNEGTAAADVNSISISPAGNTYTLGGMPALPVRMEPGATVPFSITFTPSSTGNVTGTLRIDTQTFTLSGTGSAPDPLSDYSFSGASGNIDPAQQPGIGLALKNAYPLPLTGTLTLAFNSDVFATDPSVQFASGGRAVNFTIPAGQKEAVFANGATQMRVQTGTVAGNITLSPTFATTGGTDLTPQNPAVLSLSVPQQAPKIVGLAVSNKTGNGFTVLVTGYSTSRSVTQMDFTFTPVSGENIGTQKLTVNVEASFTAWYQSSTSQQYGSQFTASIPFTLQGDVNNVGTVVDAIQSVGVTLTNRQGVSESRSIGLK